MKVPLKSCQEQYVGLYGTKFGHSPYNWKAETLREMYDVIADRLGHAQVKKPVPGDSYRKMYKPVDGQTDPPTFKRMPQEIIITQPPRLFRSRAWSYRGVVYGEVDTHWRFQYKFKRIDPITEKAIIYLDGSKSPVWEIDPYTGDILYQNQWEYSWMPVFLLSNCYISQTLTFTKPTINQQLTLF